MSSAKEQEKKTEEKKEEKPTNLKKGVYTECGYCGGIHRYETTCPFAALNNHRYADCEVCGKIFNVRRCKGCIGTTWYCDCGKKAGKDSTTCENWPMCDY